MSVDPKSAEARAAAPAPIPSETPPTASASGANIPASGHPLEGYGVTGEGASDYSPRGYAPEGADANDNLTAADPPYAPAPVTHWDPAYGSAPYSSPAPLADGAATDAPSGSFEAEPWTPYASSATIALSAYSPEQFAGETPISSTAEPVVEYMPFPNPGFPAPSYYEAIPGPPGMMASPDGAGAPPMPMMHDPALEARVTALEWHAYEAASRARDAEIDLLLHKVGTLEEMIMRFLSEIPIRLGGEIGVLERRVTYLTEELPARVQAKPGVSAEKVEQLSQKVVALEQFAQSESGASAEMIERLNQTVAALERFAQTMPSARWFHDQEVRGEALERRIIELEQFCTALARKGTGPREVAASTADDSVGMAGGNGHPRGAAANRNGAPSHGIHLRDPERRRPRHE